MQTITLTLAHSHILSTLSRTEHTLVHSLLQYSLALTHLCSTQLHSFALPCEGALLGGDLQLHPFDSLHLALGAAWPLANLGGLWCGGCSGLSAHYLQLTPLMVSNRRSGVRHLRLSHHCITRGGEADSHSPGGCEGMARVPSWRSSEKGQHARYRWHTSHTSGASCSLHTLCTLCCLSSRTLPDGRTHATTTVFDAEPQAGQLILSPCTGWPLLISHCRSQHQPTLPTSISDASPVSVMHG